MSRFDLAAMARRQRNIRRRSIVLRDIVPPGTLATNLYLAAYKPMLDIWQQAAPRIMAAYEQTLSSMTTDSPADVQAEIEQADTLLQRLVLLLRPALRDWSLRVEQYNRSRWRGAVLSATGVDLQTVIGPEDARETIESYVAWNVELVQDVSAQARKRIADAAFAGLQNRTPAREFAAQVREATGFARDRSLRVASDQLSKLSGALADERRRDAGLDVWRWRHSGKRHPRVDHQARNDELYTDNPELVGKSVGGQTIRAAPEEKDRPSRPPFCGCRAQAEMIFTFD